MSLQYYDVNLNPNATQEVSAQGRYIYYYKGSTPLIDGGVTQSAAGNQALKVTAGTSGVSILLMPGQSYRLPPHEKAPGMWKVSNFKNAEAITGQVLIGEGDFQDSNTSNTNYLKLDASFANSVTVTNTGAQRIPVALDPAVPQVIGNTTAQRVPVTLDLTQTVQTINTQATMQYTASFDSTATSNNALQVVSAAANVNGIDVKQFLCAGAAGAASPLGLLAKATAPASLVDGDLIDALYVTTAAAVLKSPTMVRVPPGKGLWILGAGDTGASLSKSVLYTLL